jgi:ArsR family transcriptional regulator, arsenate/arsenite/antimonite-responsive transcriptional repressor
MQVKEAVFALSALSHESRLAIFRHLVEAGPAGDTPGSLAARLDIAPSTLSFHLKELAHAGLVTSRASSRFLVYSVDFGQMASLMTFLTRNCCGGMPADCLTTVETALAACPPPVKKTLP